MDSASDPPPARAACLTPAQLATLRAAEPGQAPEALARHLASCVACQERLLLDGQVRRRPRHLSPELPSLRRGLLLLGIVVLAIVAFLYTLSRLAGSVR